MVTGNDLAPRKSLGQHWLTDQDSLDAIIDLADILSTDTVLEIGPGKGALTKLITEKANNVVAVELDTKLSVYLKSLNISNLEVKNEDILSFDFNNLDNYKLIANIPYYLTGKIIRLISETTNPPTLAVMLVQKEIADRLAAKPGDLSVLGITCQYFWQVELGPIVTADKFDPPPKVNSQIVKLTPIKQSLTKEKQTEFFRLVKIGFSSKRKTILNNLSSGYRMDKNETETLLNAANIEPTRRAQTLAIDEWKTLLNTIAI